MSDIFTFKYTMFDTRTLDSSIRQHSYFTKQPYSENPNSISALTESNHIVWLFEVPDFREMILDAAAFKSDQWRYKCEIEKKNFETIPNDGGDIDFIGIETIPSEATCIEFKNVKVSICNDGNEKVTKLNKLGKLVKQGNERRGQGFYKTFIAAIASIDSADCNVYNSFIPEMKSEDVKRLYNIHNEYSLDDEVGIILIEIVQPTSRTLDTTCCFGVCQARSAKPQQQSKTLTSDIKRIFGIL